MEKTIASISTPLGKGAISIVRMSGDESLKITSQVFCSKNLDFSKIEERKLYLGNILIDQNIKENCLMVYFKNPNSYTGEDLVEFQIHGNVILTQKILQLLVENGCDYAEPGEFTKRAFLNGKISLDKAENIIEIIESENESQLKANLSIAKGELFNTIENIQNNLIEKLAQIEVVLDYPEEELEGELRTEIFSNIKEIKKQIEIILKDSENSKYLNNGIKVALIGKTNVGKSSILNALLKQDKAIVTDIAGTTRDFVEGVYYYKGIKVCITDTAGIRQSEDIVEKIGIDKSKKIIEEADVNLFVFDGSEDFSKDDEKILKLNKNNNYICVINKIDKNRKIKKIENEIEISALKQQNIEELKEKINNLIIKNKIDFNSLILTNERQINEVKNIKKIIDEIILAENDMLECVAFLVKKLWNAFGKITGKTENEDIIDLIFSKFCLGK